MNLERVLRRPSLATPTNRQRARLLEPRPPASSQWTLRARPLLRLHWPAVSAPPPQSLLGVIVSARSSRRSLLFLDTEARGGRDGRAGVSGARAGASGPEPRGTGDVRTDRPRRWRPHPRGRPTSSVPGFSGPLRITRPCPPGASRLLDQLSLRLVSWLLKT